MSDGVPGFPSRCLGFVANEGFSYVLGSGPNDRAYWFIMTKLDQTYYGADIPRFTDEDKEKILQDHMNDQITPDLRLSDLYNHALTTTYTPMAEFVYKHWHLGRMITIGDACHKVRRPNPASTWMRTNLWVWAGPPNYCARRQSGHRECGCGSKRSDGGFIAGSVLRAAIGVGDQVDV